MNDKPNDFARRYAAALRAHLRGAGEDFNPARSLGRKAAALRLGLLDLARAHEQALAALEPSAATPAARRRANTFFSEAIAPIAATHRAARGSRRHFERLTLKLAAARRRLRLGALRHKKAQAARRKKNERGALLLSESRRAQEGLRRLARRALEAQETDRARVSRELREEVAQNLLGINVGLLALQKEARTHTAGLQNQIASARRLVAQSAQSVRRAARAFRKA